MQTVLLMFVQPIGVCEIKVTYICHRLNSSSVELVHKFAVQPKFVELETELVLAVEQVLLIPSLKTDGVIGP